MSTSRRRKMTKFRTLRLKEGDLKYPSGRRYYGLADMDGDKATVIVNPVIRAHRDEKELLNTYAHEAVHLGDWMALRSRTNKRDGELTETEVQTIADHVAEVLWKAGYRRTIK